MRSSRNLPPVRIARARRCPTRGFGVALRLVWAGLFLILGACERTPNSRAGAPPPAPVIYEVTGVLHRADPGKGVAVIAHDEIPGYMDAMTMEFTAAAPADLTGLQPGDVLRFRLTVTDTRSSISEIRKVGWAKVPPDVAPEATAPGVPPAGTPLPECALVDDQGRPLRLADFRGRALAITFIFTRCPLPDFCPLMSRNFAEAQRALSDAKLGENWHLLAVTIDPAYDTPERLAAYAKSFRGDGGKWTFATGESGEIVNLGAAVGLATRGESPALEHNLRTLVVDRAGKIQKVFIGNEWKAAELVEEMKRVAK